MTNALLPAGLLFNYSALIVPTNFSAGGASSPKTTCRRTSPTTDAGATLGRVLFYDKRLSTNQTIACASCHQQATAFADPRRFSVGYNGSVGTRNAMGGQCGLLPVQTFLPGINTPTRWKPKAHAMPIQNPIEMGMTLDTLTNRIAAEPFTPTCSPPPLARPMSPPAAFPLRSHIRPFHRLSAVQIRHGPDE